MPTILMIYGWRLFFYANEGNEPIHIHCQKGDCECKYWLDVENYEIIGAFEYNVTPRLRREIKKIIYNNFDYIVEEWIDSRKIGMSKIHNIENVNFSGNSMFLKIDGNDYKFELKRYSKKLLNSSQLQRENFEISPAGYGIYWPLIDEDLSIDSLLGIKHKIPISKKVG